MIQTTPLVEISFVTDTSVPVFALGDITGFFNHDSMIEYVSVYGETLLVSHLNLLIKQVQDAADALNNTAFTKTDESYYNL